MCCIILKTSMRLLRKSMKAILKALNYRYDITELEKEWFEAIAYLKRFQLIDSEHVINNLLEDGINLYLPKGHKERCWMWISALILL